MKNIVNLEKCLITTLIVTTVALFSEILAMTALVWFYYGFKMSLLFVPKLYPTVYYLIFVMASIALAGSAITFTIMLRKKLCLKGKLLYIWSASTAAIGLVLAIFQLANLCLFNV